MTDLAETQLVSHLPINLNVRGITPSATLAINERSNALRVMGRMVFKLGLGQSPFPVPEVVVEALRRHAGEKDYLDVQGLLPLRRAVADYVKRRCAIETDASNVLVGPGSKELMFLLQLVYYGDLVIPTPTWVSYAPQAQIIGRHVRWIPTRLENEWRIQPEDLEALCKSDPGRPRLVILNYPGNPTGCTYTAEDLAAIAAVARKYRLIILSDEIYGMLHHTGDHRSIAPYYPEGTIYSGGLSKWCGAGGWRLGVFVFPPPLSWLRDAMKAVASETYTSTSAPIQYAAVRAFEEGAEIERYLCHSRLILQAIGRRLAATLREAGALLAAPSGGFYLFPDFSPLRDRLEPRGIHTSVDFCERLLEDTGVAVLPGAAFGRPEHELSLRIAYVNFHGETALRAVEEEGADVLAAPAFLPTYCPETLEAVDRLCGWVAD